MNERIKEFATLAKEHADTYDDAGTPIWFHFYNEKFAELIVRECSKAITQGGYWNHALKGRTPASPSEIAKMVEDYFGVEE